MISVVDLSRYVVAEDQITMRVELIGHFQPCMTEIYLHIDARMADYIRTHPYGSVARLRRRRRPIAVHYWRHHSADSTLHLSFRGKIFVSLATAFAKTGASDL